MSSQIISAPQPEAKKPPKSEVQTSRPPWRKIAGVVLAVLAVGGGVWYVGWGRHGEASQAESSHASSSAASIQVDVVHPRKGGIVRLEHGGIGPPVRGRRPVRQRLRLSEVGDDHGGRQAGDGRYRRPRQEGRMSWRSSTCPRSRPPGTRPPPTSTRPRLRPGRPRGGRNSQGRLRRDQGRRRRGRGQRRPLHRRQERDVQGVSTGTRG